MGKEFFHRDIQLFMDHRVDWARYFKLRDGDSVNPSDELDTYRTVLRTMGEICEDIEAGAIDHWHEEVRLEDGKVIVPPHIAAGYAKLKQARLAQVANLEGEPQELSDEVADALDNALAEARHAVAAMRGTSQEGPLVDLLGRLVDDFADRFALRADLTTDGHAPEIGARAQAEVIRIVQEALTNVRKHADATVVRVAVVTDDGVMRITINDNGRGFHPEASHGGFGLDSMRERAALIGATLTVSSQPQDGSRVELRLPLGHGAVSHGG